MCRADLMAGITSLTVLSEDGGNRTLGMAQCRRKDAFVVGMDCVPPRNGDRWNVRWYTSSFMFCVMYYVSWKNVY